MGKPTFVFIHGIFHTASCYDSLITFLEPVGYECVAITNPSVGCNPVVHDFTEDVKFIRNIVQGLAEEGKEIIVVMHSYGGMCGGQALERLGREYRELKGLEGGVVKLVYVMALMFVEGTQPATRETVQALFPSMEVDVETGVSVISPAAATKVFYNDLSSKEIEKLTPKLVSQSLEVFYGTVTYAPWREISTTYVLCENDCAVKLPFVESLITAAKATGNHMIDTLERCDAGHFVILSHPEWLAGILKRAAGERAGLGVARRDSDMQ